MSSDELKILTQQIAEVNRNVRILTDALVGDINDPSKTSVYTRLDRLEQTEKARGRLVWIILAGVVSLVLERISGVM